MDLLSWMFGSPAGRKRAAMRKLTLREMDAPNWNVGNPRIYKIATTVFWEMGETWTDDDAGLDDRIGDSFEAPQWRVVREFLMRAIPLILQSSGVYDEYKRRRGLCRTSPSTVFK